VVESLSGRERIVSLELDIAPEVDHGVLDRLKPREGLAGLLRNALSALFERGGRLGDVRPDL
jgi:hypothetical protein